MDVCLLSSAEVGQLEHYKMLPNHENHIHISYEEAIKGLKDEEYFALQHENGGRTYLAKTKLYFLRKVKSGGKGGLPIVQRVVSNSLKHLMLPKN